MKKLLYLLLILPLFASCSSDDNNSGDPYIDKSILYGKWYYLHNTDSAVYVFDEYKFQINKYDRYIKDYLKDSWSYRDYNLTAKSIFYNNGVKSNYYLKDDSLFIDMSSDNKGVYYGLKRIKATD